MISAGSSALLVLGGVVAGVVGTAGGITSLVSFPVLLAVGVPPLAANVANLVAATACWPGSFLASRRELAGTGRWLVRGLAVAAAGAAVGAALLLSTPPGAFSRAVPFLVASASVALLAQPWLTSRRRQRRDGGPAGRTATLLAIGAVSIYSGYFGAGSGVLLLALLLVLVDDRLPHANASKNMLLGASGAASSAVFVLVGPVEWAAICPMAAGLFAGSLLGPVAARRLPSSILRHTIALLGLALALRLWLSPV